MMRSLFRAVCLLVLGAGALLGDLGSAQGQEPAGATLRVRATDAQQFPVPGATCALLTALTATPMQTVTTDPHGTAVFSRVPPGRYVVRVSLDGFDPFVRTAVAVEAGEATHIDAMLVLARVSQSVTVSAPAATDRSVAAGSDPPAGQMDRAVLKRVPVATATLEDILPMVPGVMRSTTGELSFKGAGEDQSALRVNGLNAVDPATGGFRLSLPIDAVEDVQVFLPAYAAEDGDFTGGMTRVHTRPGSDTWRFELNDFLPDFRFINGTVMGVSEDSPHLNLSGPLFRHKLLLSQSASYTIAKVPVRGLDFPVNETRTEAQSYFTQLDFSAHKGHAQTVTLGYAPERRDFVGLDVFRPQPVTPSTIEHDATLTARDNSQILGGLLKSAVSVRRFETRIFGQGSGGMTITPTAEEGHYFARQTRQSARVEVLEVYGVPTQHWLGGAHDLKFGLDFNNKVSRQDDEGQTVHVVRDDGTVSEQIEFSAAPTIRARNREYVGFAQDRWSFGNRVSLDIGLRYEDQRIADAALLAPRMGFAWSPTADGATVVRGGIGLFYDKVPLNIRSFARYPTRTVTWYGDDGLTPIRSLRYRNVLVDAVEISTFDPRKALAQTEFVPENLTWNLEVDRTVSPWLAVRANVVSSQTSGLYIVEPDLSFTGRNVIELSSTGTSMYRAAEFTARLGPSARSMNISYTRSRARGDLNDFSSIFGDISAPLIRANQYSQLPTDAPNRLVAWGTFDLPRRVMLSPVFEVRTGFPYSVVDAEQNFVDVRNADTTRFPRFVALDLEVAKDVKITAKYAARISARGFNLFNHFNPRDVHANTADPAFGQFLSSYRRYFSGGFDILF